MNPALIRRYPREYTSLRRYVAELKGGFTIRGRRLEQTAGLKVITLLFALAGLARSL